MATGVDAKLLKSTKFPPEFNQKVDMQKVNVQVMKKSALDSRFLSFFFFLQLCLLTNCPNQTDGLPTGLQRFWETKTTWLSS